MTAPVPTKTTSGSMRFHPSLGKTTFAIVGFTGSLSMSLCLQILCGMGKVAANTAPATITRMLHFFCLNLEQPTTDDIELRLCSADVIEREDKYISYVDIYVI